MVSGGLMWFCLPFRWILRAVLLMLLIFAAAPPCHPADFNDCANSLDALDGASVEASDTARDAQGSQEELTDFNNDLKACSGACDVEHLRSEVARAIEEKRTALLKERLASLKAQTVSAST